MTRRTSLLFGTTLAAGALATGIASGNVPAYDPPVELDLAFVFHIDQDLAEGEFPTLVQLYLVLPPRAGI